MFSRSPETPADPAKPAPKPTPIFTGKTAPSGTPSIIATDVRIIGDVMTNGEIQLDGTVEGDVRASSLTLGETGMVKGTVTADTINVKGSVEGQIRGRSVRVEKTAKIRGDLCHEIVSVEAGAIVEGNFSHTTNPLEDRRGENRDQRVKMIGDQNGTRPGAASPTPAVAQGEAS